MKTFNFDENIFDLASQATLLHSVPASNALKSNMAANAEFQDLAASSQVIALILTVII